MKTLEPTEPLQERSFHTTFLFVMRKTYLMELNQHNQHLFGKKKKINQLMNTCTNYSTSLSILIIMFTLLMALFSTHLVPLET